MKTSSEDTDKPTMPSEQKSSREKMKDMLNTRRNKKITKSFPLDQQILALNKEEIELKREMMRRMDKQEQQFNRTMETLQANMAKFTDIVSNSMQMMSSLLPQNAYFVQQPQFPHYPNNQNATGLLSNLPKNNESNNENEKQYTDL